MTTENILGKCSCAGCGEDAVALLGGTKEPVCPSHLKAWLEGHEKAMSFVSEQLSKLQERKPNDPKAEAWRTLRQNVTALGHSVDALHDLSRTDPPLEGAVDGLYVLVNSMKRVVTILAEPEIAKEGEKPK